ncbi:MAG: hypothetical protein HYX68_27045 [Planctomycetes bacterium]|nr:hypothetical protein [Planctomycetota bacterium]
MSTNIASAELRTTLEGTTPTQINGVSLFNQKGKLKSRYSWDEKLRMLGCTEIQFHAFGDLLAPRKSPFGMRRASATDTGHWFTVKRELTLDLIVWHLLGARIPNRLPLWIGPRAWDWTRFVAIDVDLRNGNETDFRRRCREVEEAFRLLEVPPESWLIVPTPSGGRHYYFFTSDRIRTAEIAPTMAQAGIVASKGKFEIFPSTVQILRLPFGHIPNHPHQPDEWIRFIDNYQTGRLPTINWEMCKHVAKKHASSRETTTPLFLPEQKESPATDRKRQGKRKPTIRSPEYSPVAGMSKVDRQKLQRYDKLLSSPVESPADIEQLLDLGIRCEGTRHEAIMRLAWNFVFVRGCKEEDAICEITDWAYRTGEGISKDVDADLTKGSHKVEDDVKDLVQHFVRIRDNQGSVSVCLFAEEELDAIKNATIGAEPRLCFARGRFLVEFLQFAKTNGRLTKDGWECCPAAEGIIRKWRGCSGQRYKPHLDWAQEQGIVVMTKEKRQTQDRTGCTRTFLLRIPTAARMAWKLTRDDVLARLKQFSFAPKNAPKSTGSPCEKSDRYLVGFPTKEENSPEKEKASDLTPETVRKETEETVEQTKANPFPGNGPFGPAITLPTRNENHAERSLGPAHAAGAGGPDDAPAAPTTNRDGPGNQRGEYQGRAICHLATGTPECPPIGSTLQGIRDPSAGPIRTIFNRRNNRRFRITILQKPAEPETIDAATVQRQIAEVKQALVADHPDKRAYVEAHPTWPLIEAMALDPAYSVRQRSVLLANPQHLAPSELKYRKELIREYRDQETINSPPAKGPSAPIDPRSHISQTIPTESLQLSG